MQPSDHNGQDGVTVPSRKTADPDEALSKANDSTGQRHNRMVNLPNAITIFRVLLVPIIVWLLTIGDLRLAFLLFCLAGVSDALDGFIAKRFDLRTELGSYLDPLADKLLISGVFITLGVLGEIPAWLVIAVVTRDILIVIAVLLSGLVGQPVRINPLVVSKINTSLQILLAATALADSGFQLGLSDVRQVLIWATAVFTVASLAAYIRAWLRHMTGASDQASKAP